MKNHTDLLQKDELVNSDADLTADESKTNEDSDNMNISMEEEQNNV